MSVFAELSSTKRLRSAEINAIFSEFYFFEITPKNAPAKMQEGSQNVGFPSRLRDGSYHTTDDIHRNVPGSDLVCIDSPLLASCPSTESVERMLSFAVKLTCQRAWQQHCNNGVSVLAKSRGSTSADPVGGTI